MKRKTQAIIMPLKMYSSSVVGKGFFDFVRKCLSIFLVLGCITQNAQGQTTETLYLSDPSQTLDRVDPNASGDVTDASTGILSKEIVGSITDSISAISYSGNNSTGPLGWTSDWIETEINPPAGHAPGPLQGWVFANEYPSFSGEFEVAIADINVGDNLIRSFDLTGVDSADLVVNVGINFGNPNNSDIWRLSLSSDGGSNYTTLMDLGKNDQNATYTFPITTFTSDMVFKFELVSRAGSNGTGMVLTDVNIVYRIPESAPETFTMDIPFCEDIRLAAGQDFNIRTYAGITQGSVPANPDVDAVLTYGSGPTQIIDLSGISPTWDGSAFEWTGTIPSDITVPAGEAISLQVTNQDTSFSFQINYDSQNYPSRIEIPALDNINIDAQATYSDTYPAGTSITQEIVGSAVYLRSEVSSPFGTYDISGFEYSIVDPNLDTTSYMATEMAVSGCSKTYELAWTMPKIGGDYYIIGTAYSGATGIVHSDTTSLLGIIPVLLDQTLLSPASGPYTLNDLLVYDIEVENSSPLSLTTLPILALYDDACLEYISSTITPDNLANGSILWNDLGNLPSLGTTNLEVTYRVIGNCEPTRNIAKVEGAFYNGSYPLPPVYDTLDVSIDEPPISMDDLFQITGSTNLAVLANDVDPDGDMTSLSIVSPPGTGVATVNGLTIDFDPVGMSEDQVVTFRYSICDNASPVPYCSEADARVVFSTVNNAPLLVDDIASTTLNASITLDVLSNDSDIDGDLNSGTLTITIDPQFGSATVNPEGTITYTPNNDYYGNDQFTYTICDNGNPVPAECSTADVNISVVYVYYVCKNSTSTIRVPAVSGAESYEWDLPAGAIIVSGANSNEMEVDFSAVVDSNFTLCVRPSNFCGPGTEQCVEVQISDITLNIVPMDALCLGEDSGSIDLFINGGVSPYSFSWSNGSSVQNLSDIGAGSYSVTVTDRYGCTGTTSAVVSEPPSSVQITNGVVVDENPYGSANGSIDISISGGTPGYSFLWMDVSGQVISTLEDPVGLSAGTYRVVVTDSNGCSDTALYTVNVVGGPLTINAIINTDIDCFGGTTGAIDLEVTGGSGTYTYDWDNDGTGDFDDIQDLINVTAGIYIVVVDDGINPRVTDSVEVLEPAAPLAAVALGTDLTCFESDDGSIDVTVSGGTPPYFYVWDNGSTSEDLTGLPIGTYMASITDSKGCEITVSEAITQPNSIEITGIPLDNVCGPSGSGSVDISVSGGTGAYTFQWSNGASSEDLVNLDDGLYSVQVMDAVGCVNSATFDINKTCIGLAKQVVGSPVNNQDGTYSIVYQIRAENYGSMDVDSIQITEELATTFASAIGFSVDNVQILSQPSSPWVLNPDFDGDDMDGDATDLTDIFLLDSLGTLRIGERAIIEVAITIEPGSVLTYNNSASGEGSSTLGRFVSDISQDGSNADPDGDGDPTNNNDPTPVTLTENPVIGLAKNLGTTVTNNQDGTYSLWFDLKVENAGDIVLSNVQVADDLQRTFPGLNISGVSATIVDQPLSSTLTLNPSYNGLTSGDTTLLDGNGSLHVGEHADLRIEMNVEINGSLGIFYNSAYAMAISPAGNNITDISQDGVEIDPDNDGDPTNNNDPTPVSFMENPVITIDKKIISSTINNGDGTFDIRYSLEVSNQGNVPLLNLQVVDDLNTAFPALAVTNGAVSIVTQPMTTTLQANSNYNGLTAGDYNLLAVGARLNVGELVVFEVSATVELNGSLGPFTNLAQATGNGPGGTPASDMDDEIVSLTESPSIGLAKTVDIPINNQDGSYSINYSILVENTGEVPLRNLQIEDDLTATFEAATFIVTNVSSTTLNVNSSYNGLAGGDVQLLQGTDALDVGAVAHVVISLTVFPGSKLGIYYNSALGIAQGPGGTTVSDLSQDGTDVDPDNDGDPTNNNVPTPVSFLENPIIGLAKDVITSITNNMDGSFSFSYEIRVENMGDVRLYNVQVVDNLAETFLLADGFVVTGYSINQHPSSGTWILSSTFDGDSDIRLLTGANDLLVGEVARIQIDMRVTPGAFGGPYWNSAIGFGASPAGRTVSDYSQDGLDPDPDNDGIPTNNNDPTPVIFFLPNSTIAEDDYNQTLIDIPVYGDLSINDRDPEGDNQQTVFVSYDSDNDGTYDHQTALVSGSITTQISGINENENFVSNSGSITVYSNGLYAFVPSPGFIGTAYMQYEVVDDNLNPKMDDAILVIEVSGPNIGDLYPPIAQDDNATTAPDVNVDIEILSNDSDVDGYLINSSIDLNTDVPGIQDIFVAAGEGTYTVNHITGIVTFDPIPEFLGTVTPVEYQVCDNDGLCDEANILVNIYDENANRMTAEDDANSGYSGDTLTGNILINDIDPDGSDGIPAVNDAIADGDADGSTDDNLTLMLETIVFGESINNPGSIMQAGRLSVDANGDYIYVSYPFFEGTIYIPYTACDNNSINACAKATLYLTTARRNTTVAEDDYNQTLRDVSVSGDVSINDYDPEGDNQSVTSALADLDGDGVVDDFLNLHLSTPVFGRNEMGDTVLAGMLDLDDMGLYTFDPESTFIGTLVINYTATDDNGQPASDDANLVIDVTGSTVGNLYPPVALDDNATTEPDVNVEIPVLDNDNDVDGYLVPSTLDLDPSTTGIQSSIVVLDEGTFTIITSPSTMEQVVLFDPLPEFLGSTTSIDYSICDNDALCDEAQITVVISDPTLNEMTAEDDSNIGDCSGTVLSGNVLSNDIDPDGSTGIPDVDNAYVDSDGDGQVDNLLTLGTATTIFAEDYENPGTYIAAGLFTLNSNGNYSFISDLLFKGTVYIPYTACDNDTNNACDNATLYLTMARDNPNSLILGDTTLCVGESAVLLPSAIGSWESSDTTVAIVSNDGNVMTIGAGTADFRFTDTSTGCVYNPTSEITVIPNDVIAINGDSIVCEDNTITLSATFPNGTWSSSNDGIASISTNGEVTGVSEGAAIITYTHDPSQCANDPTFVVTVSGRSTVAVSGPEEICPGEVTFLTSSHSGGIWMSSNDSIAIVSSEGIAVGLSGGTANFSYLSNNGCLSDATLPITVNPAIDVEIDFLGELCLEDDSQLFAIPEGGTPAYTYSWSGPEGFVSTEDTVDIPLSGLYNVLVTDNVGCTADYTTLVFEAFEPYIFALNTEICEGEDVTLSINGGSGSSYVWSANAGSETSESVTVSPPIPGDSYHVTITNSLGCIEVATSEIEVSALPVVNITGDDEICEGSTTTLSPTDGGVWYSSDNSVAIVNDSGIVTGITGGAASFRYREDSTGCYSEASEDVTVFSKDTIIINGSNEICTGFPQLFSASEAGGIWSSSNSAVATVDSVGEVNAVSPGQATIIYTPAPNTCFAVASKTISVNSIPVVSLNGPATICAGGITYLSPGSGGIWSSSDTTIAVVSAIGEVTGVSAGDALFTFTANSGCQEILGTPITVVSTPDVSLNGPSSLCINETTTLLPNSGGIWISSNNSVASVDANGIVTAVSGGIANFTFIEFTNGCIGSEILEITVNDRPAISGFTSDNICIGETASISPSVGGNWISSDTSVATINPSGMIYGEGSGTAIFTFVDSITGCSSLPSLPLTVHNNPVISITGPTAICIGETTSVIPASGGVWSTSDVSIATINNQGEITGISAGAVTFLYTSVATGCTSSPSDVFTVSNPTGATIDGPASLCIGESELMTANEMGSWQSSNESVIVIDSIGQVTALEAGMSTITLDVVASCVDNPTFNITVESDPVVSYHGLDELCLGDTTVLSPFSGGIWTSSDSTIATIDHTGKVTTLSSGITNFTFEHGITGCSATSGALTISDAPVITISGSDSICIGGTTSMIPSSGVTWKRSNNAIASIDEFGVVSGISTGKPAFTYVDATSGCVSEVSDSIVVLSKPDALLVGTNSLCVGETTVLSPSSGGSWTSTNPSVAIVSDSGIVTAISQGVAKFTFISDSGCVSDQTAPVIVFGLPTVSINGSDQLCIGEIVQLIPVIQGIWTSSDTTVATVDDFGRVTAISSGMASFTLTDSTYGCTSLASDSITVNDNPIVELTGLDSICMGSSTNFTPQSGGIWSSLSPSVATIENNGTVTGISPGNVQFTFLHLNSGCISDTTEAITVINQVDPIFSGPDVICVGETTSLIPNTAGTWISSNLEVATVTNTGVVTGVNQGTAAFQYTDAITGCISSFTSDLLVNGNPLVSISGEDQICVGTTTTLSPSSGGIWNSTNPSVASVSADGIVTGISAGSSSFIYQDSISGCESDGNLTITVSEGISITISTPTDICTGYSTNLLPATGGFWISSNPAIASITNSGVVTAKAPGKVTFDFIETTTGCFVSSTSEEVNIQNCVNHDFNVALANEPISGKLQTNDNVNSMVYSIATLSSKPPISNPNLYVDMDGNYTFLTSTEGKYLYEIAVCDSVFTSNCTETYLEINVVDNIYSVSNPVSNLEFASIYSNSINSFMGTEVVLSTLANDACILTGGCDLDSSSVAILESPKNGIATVESNGDIQYVPNAGYVGSEELVYQVCIQNSSKCSFSRQIITVIDNSAENSLIAVDDFGHMIQGTSFMGNVMTNDSDPEDDNLKIVPAGSLMFPVEITGGEYYIDSLGNFEFIPNPNFSGYTEFTYTLCDDNSVAECTDATVHIQVFKYLTLSVRLYLEGAIMQNGGVTSATTGRPLMRDDIRVSPFTGENYIPLNDPYKIQADPFINTPSKYNQIGPHLIDENTFVSDSLAVMSVTGDDAIVDWVYIELRSKDDMTLPIATRSGLLQRDGDVVDVDGVSALRFQGINVDSFYVVAKHRSHLGVMSMKVSSEDLIDFTSTEFETFNFGTSLENDVDYTGLSQKNSLLNGYNVLWGGDFDSNGKIKFTNPGDDQNVMFLDVLFSSPEFLINYNNAYGYLTGDFNMDGKTKYTNPSDDLNYLFSQILLFPRNTSFLSNFDSLIEQIPK